VVSKLLEVTETARQLERPTRRRCGMERRLFELLVVPPERGGERRRAGLLPVSLVIHAVVVGVVLVAPVLTSGELPPPARSPTDGLMVPAVLVPPPPPPRGISPRHLIRRVDRAHGPTPSVPDPAAFSVPTSWSELPPPEEPGWGLSDLPACEGCVPWGVEDGVPIGEPTPALLPPEPVLRVDGGVESPIKLRDVRPEYPEIAILARVEGEVVVECRVDTRGHVVDARVLRGHALLSPAALNAIRQWRYRPTLLHGQPVSVIMTVTVRFQLRR
jgi:protein TonB